MSFFVGLTVFGSGYFALTDAEGADKGSGTYSLEDGVYTFDFGSEKTTDAVVNADGSIKVLTKLYYGAASIDPASIEGDVVLTPAVD